MKQRMFFGGIVGLLLASTLTACGPGVSMSSGGGATAGGPAGVATGQTAQQVAADLGMDPSKVGPIDSTAVGATGEGQSVGDTVTGEGLTQGDLGPEAGAGDPPMNDSTSAPADPPML